MDREDWIDLYRWLEAAKPGEIFARRDKAREVLRQLRDPDIRADVRRNHPGDGPGAGGAGRSRSLAQASLSAPRRERMPSIS